MTQISAYLHFKGNCREAMTFYKECLGGELSMQAIGEMAGGDNAPVEMQKNIVHAYLAKGSMVLQGSDMAGPEGLIKGNTVSLALDCESEEEIQTFFTNLSAGGQVGDPLHIEFWDGTFGTLTDKYGHDWMLNYSKPTQA